jgi:hypothetical protein
MRSIGWSGVLKGALPFFATFAVALFITSFFVDLRGPRFGRHGRGWERHQMKKRLKAENERLRTENEELRRQLESRSWEINHHPGEGKKRIVELPVPPLAPVAPHSHQ